VQNTVALIIDDSDAASRASEAVLSAPSRPSVLTFQSVDDFRSHLENRGDPIRGVCKMIVLDQRISSGDLLQAIRSIRSLPCASTSPIVVFVPDGAQDKVAPYSDGANSVIRRPAEPTAYSEAMREVAHYWLVHNRLPG
jgi:DNA-binding response OmpR family regulator